MSVKFVNNLTLKVKSQEHKEIRTDPWAKQGKHEHANSDGDALVTRDAIDFFLSAVLTNSGHTVVFVHEKNEVSKLKAKGSASGENELSK